MAKPTNVILLDSLLGAIIGFFVLHPIAMLITRHSIHATIPDLQLHSFMDVLSGPHFGMSLYFSILGFSFGFLTGFFHARLLCQNEELKKKNSELESARTEIQQMGELLPICSYCKKIRDDKGYWQQLEAYFAQHSKTLFSHGVCPACLEKALEEIEPVKANKAE